MIERISWDANKKSERDIAKKRTLDRKREKERGRGRNKREREREREKERERRRYREFVLAKFLFTR